MPSASCCFLHVFYIAGNQYQTKSKRRKCLKDFLGQKTSSGPRKHLGVPRGEQHPPGHARRPRRALVGCAPLEAPPRCFLGPLDVLWPKKSSKSFAAFGLRLVLISCDVKTCRKQQLALGTMSIG